MAPRFVNRQEKRRAILQAAMAVFARKGFSATKVADIAREAGIGKGTVYEYFSSKDEIFFALYRQMRDEFHRRVFASKKALSPRRKIEDFITSALGAFEQWRELSRVLLEFWAEHRGGGAIEFRFDEIYKDARARLAGIVREGIRKGVFRKVNAINVASLLIAVVDGLLLQWVFNPEGFPLSRTGRDAVRVFLRGIERQ